MQMFILYFQPVNFVVQKFNYLFSILKCWQEKLILRFLFTLIEWNKFWKKICKSIFSHKFSFYTRLISISFPYRTENIHTCIIGKTVFGWWLGVKRRAQFCSQGLRTSREPWRLGFSILISTLTLYSTKCIDSTTLVLFEAIFH